MMNELSVFHGFGVFAKNNVHSSLGDRRFCPFVGPIRVTQCDDIRRFCAFDEIKIPQLMSSSSFSVASALLVPVHGVYFSAGMVLVFGFLLLVFLPHRNELNEPQCRIENDVTHAIRWPTTYKNSLHRYVLNQLPVGKSVCLPSAHRTRPHHITYSWQWKYCSRAWYLGPVSVASSPPIERKQYTFTYLPSSFALRIQCWNGHKPSVPRSGTKTCYRVSSIHPYRT